MSLRKLLLVHLPFWRVISLEELCPGTDAAERLENDLSSVRDQLAKLTPDTVEYLEDVWQGEYTWVRQDIDTVRSRASQLLAVTGFVGALATLVGTVPSAQPWRIASFVVLAALVYAFSGTLWLTIASLKVRSWDELAASPPRPGRATELQVARRTRAFELYHVSRRLRIRLTAPVGYLRDAHWYFGATALLLLMLLVLRVAGSGDTANGPVPAPLPPRASASAAPTVTLVPTPVP